MLLIKQASPPAAAQLPCCLAAYGRKSAKCQPATVSPNLLVHHGHHLLRHRVLSQRTKSSSGAAGSCTRGHCSRAATTLLPPAPPHLPQPSAAPTLNCRSKICENTISERASICRQGPTESAGCLVAGPSLRLSRHTPCLRQPPLTWRISVRAADAPYRAEPCGSFLICIAVMERREVA